jgi:uncharacterized OB-fold protein
MANVDSKSYLPTGLPIPRPTPDGLDKPFWDAAARHELVVQKCAKCATLQFAPEWICYKCHSFELTWQKLSGRGRIYSWERVWNPAHPALKDALPYIVVLVELDGTDNIRMVGNLLGDPKQEVRIGAEVEAVFEDHPEHQFTLINWRLSP